MKRVITFLGLFLIGASANGANEQKTDGIAIPDWSRGNAIPNSPVKSTTPKKTTANTQASSVQKTTLDAKSEAATKIKSTKIDNFTAYSNGVVVDNNTKLMWMRCSLGQTWDGKTCVGQAQADTWEESLSLVNELNKQTYGGYNDWRLPYIEELHSLVYCSMGFIKKNNIPTKKGGFKMVEEGCAGKNYQKPTINESAFPNTYNKVYWSLSIYVSPNGEKDKERWGVFFSRGVDSYYDKNSKRYIRVVRDIK